MAPYKQHLGFLGVVVDKGCVSVKRRQSKKGGRGKKSQGGVTWKRTPHPRLFSESHEVTLALSRPEIPIKSTLWGKLCSHRRKTTPACNTPDHTSVVEILFSSPKVITALVRTLCDRLFVLWKEKESAQLQTSALMWRLSTHPPLTVWDKSNTH